MVDRFRVLVHAHVELDSHYHLILQTPDANLSKAVQWLNVSYVIWVNRRRERVGPLMQGRFKSIPVRIVSWRMSSALRSSESSDAQGAWIREMGKEGGVDRLDGP